MASSKENCQNCLQTFYTQSLVPLELVDFKFGGQILTLIGCFMESPIRPVPQDSPKICRTCLELLKTTFVGGEHSLTPRPATRKPFHICVACSEFFPANVMMSMHLTVVNCNRQRVKLFDCYKACMNQSEALSGSNLMVCLACVSTITDNFQKFYGRDMLDEVTVTECKVEPDIPFDFDYGLASVTKIELPDDGLDTQSIDESTKPKSKQESTPVKCKTEPDWPSDGDSGNSFEPPAKRRKKSSSSSSKKRKTLTKKYERYDAIVECDGCGSLKRKSQLERHFISKHYKGISYSCHHCLYFKTLTRSKILAHLYTAHFVSDNECKQCQKVLPNYRSLQTHLQKHKEAATSIQCDGCKQMFSRHQTYYLHIKANPLLFNCTECELGFHTVRALDKHMERTHKKVYTCPICQLPLHLLLTYDIHMWKQHGVRTKPRCRYCGKEFESTEQLAAHNQSEHKPLKAKNIVCEVCGKKYDTQYKLVQHIRATHNKTTGQLFTCPQCPKQYKGKTAMDCHIKRVHLNERPANSKMYPCTKCSLTFLKRQFLEGHMLCHNTENRPFFQCMQCGIAYTRRQKLEVHKNKCPNRAVSQFPSGMY